jgi:hypothetical protein
MIEAPPARVHPVQAIKAAATLARMDGLAQRLASQKIRLFEVGCAAGPGAVSGPAFSARTLSATTASGRAAGISECSGPTPLFPGVNKNKNALGVAGGVSLKTKNPDHSRGALSYKCYGITTTPPLSRKKFQNPKSLIC